MALESMQESVEDLICRLLKSLSNTCIVTPDQMKRVSVILSCLCDQLGNCFRMFMFVYF
jgi:hypothetical protein